MASKRKKTAFGKFFSIIFYLLGVIVFIVGYLYYQNVATQPKTVKIYFFKNGHFSFVERNIPKGSSILYFTAEQLMQGPNIEESKAGYFTEIPKGAEIITIYKNGDTVVADFSKELGNYGGGTLKVQRLLAQIIYTFINVSNAKKVQILINGRTEIALGSEGFLIDKPLTIEDIKQPNYYEKNNH